MNKKNEIIPTPFKITKDASPNLLYKKSSIKIGKGNFRITTQDEEGCISLRESRKFYGNLYELDLFGPCEVGYIL